MAILAECPICHRKQPTSKKICISCDLNLDKEKKAGRVRYYIRYRLPNGKQRMEYVGNKIQEAKDADGKRKGEKRENRLWDIKPDSKITFQELTDWYLKLEKVKALASYQTMQYRLTQFNVVFGDTHISDIKLTDLENYQAKRLKAGKAPATVDHEIKKMKTIIIKAFDDGMISGDPLRVFKRCKPTMKKGSDVRTRILSPDEFEAIMDNLPHYMKPVFAMGYYAGMRKSEILGLTWNRVDSKNRMIRLTAECTKDKEARDIPMCDKLYMIVKDIPKAIHENHVFLLKGKPFSSIRQALRTACKAAGVKYGRFEQEGFIFHDLRHTFNTNMRKAGVQESVIMSITGHSTREMFDRYNTIDSDDTQNAVHQLEGYLKGVHHTVHHEGKIQNG